jgi:hypothetical protein
VAELGPRALNRALLARQLLTRRARLPVPDALELLVGMQAQVPAPPYVGLWTRLAHFRPEKLSALVADRQAVRIALLRGTIHLVTARDCLGLRPVLQPVFDRGIATGQWGKALSGLDLAAVAAAGRALVEEQPRTFDQLGKLLAPRWPDRDPAALAQAVRAYLPLVQVPPRGLWGRSGSAAHTTAEHWLGRPLSAEPAPDRMLLRYLAAFGPASLADMTKWCGLTGLREVVDRLRPDLSVLRDGRGTELYDLPGAPRPDPQTPVPVRFLPEFDNVLLSHADRTRVLSDADRARVFTVNGQVRGTVLVDGFVHGAWRIAGAGRLEVEPFRALSTKDSAALIAEGHRLLAFAAPDGTHDVVLSPI